MKSRIVVLALLSAAGPVVVAAPSEAQSVNEDASTAMARARFKEGVAFYDKGEFEQARAAFLQAYALKKHPAVLLNLAWSCLKSGHALEAERYFRQFVAEGRDITAKQRADADDGLAQAHAKLGRIELVAPDGTDVTIDSEHLGKTPLGAPTAVEPGTHTVAFRSPAGAVENRTVSVLGGETIAARFTATAAVVAPPVTTPAPNTTPAETPSPSPAAPPPSAAPPVAAVSPPEPEATEHDISHGPIRAPHGPNAAILAVGGVVTVASAGVAIGMLVAKNDALDKANSLGQQIVTYSKVNGVDPKNCGAGAPAALAQPCSTWNDDNKAANTDALIGNIAIGVGAAAAVATIVYWVVAANQPAPNTAGIPIVAPMLGRSTGGLTIVAPF